MLRYFCFRFDDSNIWPDIHKPKFEPRSNSIIKNSGTTKQPGLARNTIKQMTINPFVHQASTPAPPPTASSKTCHLGPAGLSSALREVGLFPLF
ncbi:hypothetical protein RRG08_032734 [Elysia crispata]|uniref:Uncharacterized protein n=1 Tax=Elysia crispata TaxID=231223 RepID=A0AAE0YUS1_9GAST|nr:hypothetical protein RRG08_032734 [Elysia crispata]